jgi:hypothetical protein
MYASVEDVYARAGRFAGLFQVAGKHPDQTDLATELGVITDSIDVEIRAHGYDPALLDADLVSSLRDVAAWAAIVRLLPGASPGDDATETLVTRGQSILNASGFPALGEGTNVIAQMGAIAALETGTGGGGPGSSAGSFWDGLPEESIFTRLRRGDEIVLTNGAIPDSEFTAADAGPQFRRGQSL